MKKLVKTLVRYTDINLSNKAQNFWKLIEKYLLLIRFIISGGIAFGVNVIFLYILTEFFGIWYLSSAVASFTIAFIASFILQKFWTFEDSRTKDVSKQLWYFLVITLFNLVVNTVSMYILVDIIRIHYMISQIIVSASIAIYSFLIYRYVIFNVIK